MSENVFVVSEWLPKPGKEDEFWRLAQEMMARSRQEPGCIRAHATKQIKHPGSPSTSKFPIILLQQYDNVAAFDAHCASEHVTGFFKDKLEPLVEDWRCRLFAENV